MALAEFYPTSRENAPRLELYQEEGFIGGLFFKYYTYQGTVSDNIIPKAWAHVQDCFVVTIIDAQGNKAVSEIELPKGLGQVEAVRQALHELNKVKE